LNQSVCLAVWASNYVKTFCSTPAGYHNPCPVKKNWGRP
jgi:hypothetical protein